MSRLPKYILYFFGVLLLIAVVVAFFRPSSSSSARSAEPISTLISDAKATRVSKIEVTGDCLNVSLIDLTSYRTRKESNISVVQLLNDNGIDASKIEIEVKGASISGWGWLGLVLQFLPLLLFVGVGYICYQWGKSRGRKGDRP